MEDKDNSGVLFKNNSKASTKHPDYKGKATINGKEYWVSMWDNIAKSGANYLSISFQEKNAEDKKKEEPKFIEDSIPF